MASILLLAVGARAEDTPGVLSAALQKFAIEGMYTLTAICHDQGKATKYYPLNRMSILRRLDVKDRESFVVALIRSDMGSALFTFEDAQVILEGDNAIIKAETMNNGRVPAYVELKLNLKTGLASGHLFDSLGNGYKELTAERYKSLGYLVGDAVPANLPTEAEVEGVYQGTWLSDMKGNSLEGELTIRRFPSGNYTANFRTMDGVQLISEMVNGKYIRDYGVLLFGAHTRELFAKLSLRFELGEDGQLLLSGCNYGTNGAASSAKFRRLRDIDRPGR